MFHWTTTLRKHYSSPAVLNRRPLVPLGSYGTLDEKNPLQITEKTFFNLAFNQEMGKRRPFFWISIEIWEKIPSWYGEDPFFGLQTDLIWTNNFIAAQGATGESL